MNAADCATSVHHKVFAAWSVLDVTQSPLVFHTHTHAHTHTLQVSDKTEVGVMTTYNWQTSNVSLGLAGKYVMDDGAVMKVSVLFLCCEH